MMLCEPAIKGNTRSLRPVGKGQAFSLSLWNHLAVPFTELVTDKAKETGICTQNKRRKGPAAPP